jgi:hypothetical protein
MVISFAFGGRNAVGAGCRKDRLQKVAMMKRRVGRMLVV